MAGLCPLNKRPRLSSSVVFTWQMISLKTRQSHCVVTSQPNEASSSRHVSLIGKLFQKSRMNQSTGHRLVRDVSAALQYNDARINMGREVNEIWLSRGDLEMGHTTSMGNSCKLSNFIRDTDKKALGVKLTFRLSTISSNAQYARQNILKHSLAIRQRR